jgi:hypothetical protein
MPIPVDFEKLIKLPAADGYPYSLRSEDLMRNFAWCDLLPSSANDTIRIELDEVPGATQQHQQRRLRVVGGGSGSDIAHEWKVRFVEDGLYSVAGGTVYSQGDPITLSDNSVSIESGFIYLKIERDEVTRELFDLTIESGSTMPSSTQQFQYIALAIVGGFPDPIIQLKFDEIRIFEDLVVVNGEFQLIGLEVSDRNTYSLP